MHSYQHSSCHSSDTCIYKTKGCTGFSGNNGKCQHETKAEITADNFVTVISAVLTGTSDGLPVTDACLKEYKNAYFEAETVGHIEPILSMCVFEDKNAVYNITIDGRTESYGVRFALTEDKKLNYIEIYYIPGGSYDGDL